MVNDKFVNLVRDVYKKYSEGNISCILYGAISTCGFSEIDDLDKIINNCAYDMLHIKSLLTDTEIDVYESDLENYKIKESESTIYIKCKHKIEVAIMY